VGMTVNLTPQLEELGRSKVASGMYTSASEVAREALRLMAKRNQLRGVRLEQLRDDIHQGPDSGTSQPWSAEASKRKGRARRARKPA
jgi:antitoxin ParD1/3/4